ncbi:hypothetical protein [Streptomyces sp.]|uniref:hypothetical protein n=1 Tax=Streptomyces sp. TaxID=1931 RepID=UPI002D5FA9C2|nr:hypothetical protein [Streptomyces sp.]HZF91640.1 hypothetical protein [Streptomyces sp.]
MRASRCVRTGGAFGQLLLVVVLALGVFVMHTLGHPDDSSGATSHSVSHDRTPGHASAGHPSDPSDPHPPAPSDPHPPAPSDPDPPASHGPGTAMDMASLCLAVLLGGWVLATLLRAAFARRPEWSAELPGRITVVRRSHPPPHGPDLTRLSVLRL